MRARALPAYEAQLATLVEHAPDGREWVHELKYEGRRIGCFVQRGEVRLVDRHGEGYTARLPEIVEAAKRLQVEQALLDGELAVVLPNGTTNSEALRAALSGAERTGLAYFAFDLLHIDGQDLRQLPLETRKARCAELLGSLQGNVIRYSPHFAAEGSTVVEHACKLGVQGVISKRRDRPYRAGTSDEWVHTRCAEQRVSKAAPLPREKLPQVSAATVAGISITTPERAVYPALGLKKLDLARYYAQVAEQMLPYIANRPLTLVRCDKGVRNPDALRADCKFLRHEPGWHRWAKPPIQRVQIHEQKKIGEYLVVDSPAALVALAQGDILEIHVWNSTTQDLERPDRLVFDLDPGAAVHWNTVIEAAHLLREELAQVELDSWVKLTGGKGLHVVVPFRPEHGWDEVFAFSRSLAESLVRKDPAAFTVDFAKGGRERKILVDYKRNHRAAVAVAAYSARARANAAVSAPLSWRELEQCPSSDAFTIATIAANPARLQHDPWKGFRSSSQRLRLS
jgi:bifunctional non-homologous end joining protein LigD